MAAAPDNTASPPKWTATVTIASQPGFTASDAVAADMALGIIAFANAGYARGLALPTGDVFDFAAPPATQGNPVAGALTTDPGEHLHRIHSSISGRSQAHLRSDTIR